MVHEGTPVGLVLNGRLVGAAEERGLRVVQAARPGYEGSTPRPGRTGRRRRPATSPQVLDAIGADEFVSIGFSGGGPHIARVRRARCRAAAWRPPRSPASAPYGVEGLDFLAGMGPENVEEFSLAVRGADALTPFLEKEAAALARDHRASRSSRPLGGLISGADAAVLDRRVRRRPRRGPARRRPAAASRAGATTTSRSPPTGDSRLDALARAGSAIWQGDQDKMVPFAHGQWLAARIPGARAHLEPGAGHLTMTVTAIDRILDDLLDLAGRCSSRQTRAGVTVSGGGRPPRTLAQALSRGCEQPSRSRRPFATRARAVGRASPGPAGQAPA